MSDVCEANDSLLRGRTCLASAKRAMRSIGLLLTVLSAVGWTSCMPSDEPSAKQRADALFEDVWEAAIERSAFLRLREGRPVERLDDISFGAFEAQVAQAREWLQRIDSIALDELQQSDRVNLAALRWDLEMLVEGERWFWHDSVLTPYMNPLPGLGQLLGALPVANAEQREEYLALLRQVPVFIGALEEHVSGQATRGVYVWRANLEPSIGIVEAHLAEDGFGPFGVAPERLAEAGEETDAFVADVLEVVNDEIDPALRSLASLLRGDYGDNALPEVGAVQLPEGEEYYRFAVRRSTTMDISPEEVHERGVALVAEMEAEMARLQAEIGFAGSRKEFHASLRANPDNFPKSPDEVAEGLMAAAASMEEVVDRYFSGRPRAPYGVERLEPELEGTLTYGIYRPPTPMQEKGRYMYNGSKLEERSRLNIRGLSLHELIPGHHFHIARQFENEQLPNIRRNQWHTAYTEGWGSYASWLGLEAGIYEDPLSEYGLYMLEIFLATRLVVDTGMNALGWSLEQGREYMREHTLESEVQIGTESVRYSADMPAQALAYQMGKLELIRLRREAEQRLGDRFDIRSFHEAVLEHGSLPMEVLRSHIDWWTENAL